MTVNYTTNLALGQPVTGTESGTWGDDVNNSVTSYLDIAIAGGLSVSITTTDVTLTLTQGTSSATNIGSTTAQYAILNISGAMTAARNLILPSSSRRYIINNNTTGGFALTVKGAATTGVTMVNGEKSHIFWNGSDYAKLSNAPGGAGTFTSITNSGLTSGRVVYSTTNGLETDSAGLTFDGTNFATTGTATAAKFIPTGSSASGNGMYLPATDALGFSTNGTNAVYIDASQNVGVGTTTLITRVTVAGGVSLSGGAGVGNAFYPYYNSATNYNAVGSDSNGGMTFITGVSSPSIRATIDSSGNVGIGTSSPGYNLNVYGSSPIIVAQDNGANGTRALIQATNTAVYFGNVYSGSNVPIVFSIGGGSGGTERMRIDSSGNLLVGTTTALSGNTFKALSGSAAATFSTATSTNFSLVYFNNGTYCGSITTNGSATAFNTSSDYRLKENVQPMMGALTKIAALKPVTYKWKINGADGEGFIAHELAEIFPDAVAGEKDAVDENGDIKPQGVDTSFLVATLTAAIQEQQALITQLTDRIAALEAR